MTTPATIVVQVAAARGRGTRLRELLETANNDVSVPAREVVDPDGGRQHVIRAEPGPLTVTYRADVVRGEVAEPDPVTEAQAVAALRPSRYCPSDRMVGVAGGTFGELPGALERVQAISAYVWRHISHEAASSGPDSDAVETCCPDAVCAATSRT